MLRKEKNGRVEVVPGMKGGEGKFLLSHIAEAGEMADQIMLYAKGALPPGSSVGLHKHTGSMEISYFLEGHGKVTEDTEKYDVGPGDISICFDGESHQIVNTGSQDLVYIVLVVKIV